MSLTPAERQRRLRAKHRLQESASLRLVIPRKMHTKLKKRAAKANLGLYEYLIQKVNLPD